MLVVIYTCNRLAHVYVSGHLHMEIIAALHTCMLLTICGEIVTELHTCFSSDRVVHVYVHKMCVCVCVCMCTCVSNACACAVREYCAYILV